MKLGPWEGLSLRDIEAYLRAQRNKLYHMGIRSKVSRNTLANANKVRDWRIYADFAQSLIHLKSRACLRGCAAYMPLPFTIHTPINKINQIDQTTR